MVRKSPTDMYQRNRTCANTLFYNEMLFVFLFNFGEITINKMPVTNKIESKIIEELFLIGV